MCFYKHDNTCPCVVGWCLVDAWRAEEELVKISSLMSKILQQTMLVSTAFLMIQVIKQSTLKYHLLLKVQEKTSWRWLQQLERTPGLQFCEGVQHRDEKSTKNYTDRKMSSKNTNMYRGKDKTMQIKVSSKKSCIL